jgi:hypothetical protein
VKLFARIPAVVLAGALLCALAACGTTESKRAVDARTEVVRFYGVDAPAVAMLVNEPARDLASLERAGADVPAWSQLSGALLGPLRAAGIGRPQLRRLMDPREEIEGVRAASLAIGIPGVGPLSPRRLLVVLVSDQTELLEQVLADSVAAGTIRRTGTLHDAELYRGDSAAYAARDGVLVAAADPTTVRAALRRRDGDSDAQLDEDVVKGVLDELRIDGPLDVYANVDRVIESDPGLAAAAAGTPWLEALRQGALTARPTGAALRLEVAVRTRGDLPESELPATATPDRFTLSPGDVTGRLGAGDPAGSLLRGITPLEGAATASPDEVRAQVVPSP